VRAGFRRGSRGAFSKKAPLGLDTEVSPEGISKTMFLRGDEGNFL